jgi:FixJ family two-component response regulator
VTDKPTVFVVDDNAGVRTSMQTLMESDGIAVETYATAAEFLDRFDPERPGCLLLDVRLHRASGLDLQDELRRRKAILPVIVITGYANVPTTIRALKGGAFDFLQKPAAPERLLERVHAAIEQDRRARESAAASAAVKRRLSRLTPRERQVLKLLSEGKASKEIAAALNISVRTVEGHRRMMLSKMQVSTAAELVHVVMSAGGEQVARSLSAGVHRGRT